jgi:hypothetical protein
MTDTYKKAVLAGGCFWVRSGMGPTSQDPASTFVNEMKQKGDRVYSSRREKAVNYFFYA